MFRDYREVLEVYSSIAVKIRLSSQYHFQCPTLPERDTRNAGVFMLLPTTFAAAGPQAQKRASASSMDTTLIMFLEAC